MPAWQHSQYQGVWVVGAAPAPAKVDPSSVVLQMLASSTTPLNKLGGARHRPVLARSGRGSVMMRFLASRIIFEASLSKENQQRLGGVVSPVGQWGHFAQWELTALVVPLPPG
jgi:hypothetical protein